MNEPVLLGLLAVAVGGGTVTAAVRSWRKPPGRHRVGPPTARFHTGAPRAYCPAEGRDTPHTLDAGRRRCLVCKTTTTAGDIDDG
ncbi:hypothetical protein E0L36_22220 [Streptomyces sp. AJS327]|uniref:hypothetical protein n=1 Tax=Streptomyces sp. AJS327 TaxID=2545265 RepID=UPI0015DF756B|nr:hypothetical protein [Streptomyces sp. AJS327]MBA0053494.1 hypothetical protein [Streptomyces sp. AJS327]